MTDAPTPTGRRPASHHPTNHAPGARMSGKFLLARLSLAWETAWPAIWPAVAIAGSFIALALFDVLPILAAWLHMTVLAILAGLFFWAAFRAIRRLTWPNHEQARRRLEQASGLQHRPLQAMDDALALGQDDPAAQALWEAHRARMERDAKSLRVGSPAPGLARRDPLALRAVLILALVIAITAGWQDPWMRFERAVSPALDSTGGNKSLVLDLWITPPEYTGLPPQFPLRGKKVPAADAEKPIETPQTTGAEPVLPTLHIPAGSLLTAQIQGAQGKKLLLGRGEKLLEFEKIDSNFSRILHKIEKDGPLSVTLADEILAKWDVTIIPDNPPVIKFPEKGKPGATPAAALQISYEGGDDYGVTGARAEIKRTYERGTVVGKAIHQITLPMPSRGARSFRETTVVDLAPHRWAGQPVLIQLIAKDALGQETRSEPLKMILPERDFTNPVARAIIEVRKRLADQPENRKRAVNNLGEIASVPGAFGHDSVVYLALASARSRLFHDSTEDAIDPVLALLWDTALRLEDGRLSVAERELRRIQQALMKALAEGAPDAELERLMRELQQAMNRFMQAMAEQMRRNPQSQKIVDFDPRTMRMMRSEDIARMMEQIRDLMKSGARQAAREMLARLQQMMQNMRSMQMVRMRGGQGRNGGPLRQLQELIRRQQELQNRTFRSGQPGQQMPGAADQKALRDMLRQLRGMMPGQGQGQRPGQGPGQMLDRADQEMQRSMRALEGGQRNDSVGAQGRALDQLRRAGRGIMQQMMERFARESGQPNRQPNGRNNPRRDPLGREVMGEDVDSHDVTIPDASSIQRARKILDELRRRSGQSNRPQLELDYINRLLQRF
jgi:uncharacterized protein (TIGR02302 family)